MNEYTPDYRVKPCDTIREVLDVQPSEVLMVTANETFGDLEASRALGMQAQLIRYGDGPKTIVELADKLTKCNEVK